MLGALGLDTDPQVPPPNVAIELCHLFDCFRIKKILEFGRTPAIFSLLRWAADRDAMVVSVSDTPRPRATLFAAAVALPYLFIDGPAAKAFDDPRLYVHAPYDLVYFHHVDLSLLQRLWQSTSSRMPLMAASSALVLPRLHEPAREDFFKSANASGRSHYQHPLALRSLHSDFTYPTGVLIRGDTSRRRVVNVSEALDRMRARWKLHKQIGDANKRMVEHNRSVVPRPPERKYHKAVCCIGDGLGNVIEQTALVQAVQTMYDVVDVWMPRSGPVCLAALKGMPGVRNMWIGFNPHPRCLAPEHYDAVFHSFLIAPKRASTIPHDERFGMAGPAAKAVSERSAAVAIARLVGYRGEDPPPFCAWEPVDRTFPGPLLGISTGGNPHPSWQLKRYPQWHDVVAYLHEKLPTLSMVLLGTKDDDAIDQSFVTDLRDKLPFRQVAGLIRDCDVFLANDCGLAHVAGALGTRTFVVFGPTALYKNTPQNAIPIFHRDMPCRPCQYSKAKIGRRRVGGAVQNCEWECLKQLHPVTIGNQILRHLGYEQLCDHRDGEKWYEVLSHYDEQVG